MSGPCIKLKFRSYLEGAGFLSTLIDGLKRGGGEWVANMLVTEGDDSLWHMSISLIPAPPPEPREEEGNWWDL